MDDTISRQAALDAIDEIESEVSDGDGFQYEKWRQYFCDLPSAEPEPEEFEWCHDCKEYDQEAHCCHRWTKVIRNTVEEIKNAQPERKRGKWIYVIKGLARGGHIAGSECSVCGECIMPHLTPNFCPNCGAEMKGEDDE